MSFREFIFGRPLRSEEQETQRIGPLRGIPILGLDALASAAYGPEAALTVLLPLGTAASVYIGSISLVIVGVLLLVYLSYRQTIEAHPDGGGSYIVAKENLGTTAGLVAASALCLDYVLNVAVAISAGVGAVVSVMPALLPHTLALCLTVLAVLTLVNLRGVREAGLAFMLPTYAFVATLAIAITIGTARVIAAHGHPTAVVRPPRAPSGLPIIPYDSSMVWLLLRAFAAGCTAMTGVEAVSNAVPLFRTPAPTQARRTLTAIIATLALLVLGIALLCRGFGIVATAPGRPGYESILSQLTAAVMGRGLFYYVTIASVFAVLCLSANTSFAAFPRLCRLLALDEFLPAEYAHPGRRLVFGVGVVTLAILAGALLIAFRGVTDRLIPLFAIGAFLAFTMSQAGMVVHWKRVGGRHSTRARLQNVAGATATAATLVVIAVSKFTEGGWISVAVIVGLLALFARIRQTEDRIDRETDVDGPLQLDEPPAPIVVVPIKRLNRVARKALRLAISMSPDVQVVQVFAEDLEMDDLRRHWEESVEQPLADAGYAAPQLVLIRSPYREFYDPLLRHVQSVARQNPRRYVAVVVPELVERRWYHFLVHSHRPTLLKGLLLLRGGSRVIVMSVPWHLRGNADDEPAAYDTALDGGDGDESVLTRR